MHLDMLFLFLLKILLCYEYDILLVNAHSKYEIFFLDSCYTFFQCLSSICEVFYFLCATYASIDNVYIVLDVACVLGHKQAMQLMQELKLLRLFSFDPLFGEHPRDSNLHHRLPETCHYWRCSLFFATVWRPSLESNQHHMTQNHISYH